MTKKVNRKDSRKNLFFLFILVQLFATQFASGAATIFSENCSTQPATWTFNSVTQKSGYWLLDNSNDYVYTPVFGAYTNLKLVSNLRSYGGGSAPECTIEISTDGGSTWAGGSDVVSGIPNSYTNYTWNIGNLTGSNNVIRWKKSGGTRSLRISNITLEGTVAATGPNISNISHTPNPVYPSSTVKVSADISDSDGIAGVELHWGTSSGSLGTTISMSSSSGNTYVADSDIPTQPTGTTVYYEIYAMDNNLDDATSSEHNYTVQAIPSITLSDNGTQVNAASVNQGTSKHTLLSFQLTIADANAELTQVDFTSAGSYIAADISKFQLWHSTSDDLSSATQLGSDISSSLGSGNHSFSSLNQALSIGNAYFWITTDVIGSATVGNTINIAAITTSDLTFSSGNKSGSSTAGGVQTIALYTGPISIAYQGFEVDPATPTDTWSYSGGSTTESNARHYSGSQSCRIGGSSTATFSNIDISNHTNVVLSVAFSSYGCDSNEDLYLDISYDNGSSWSGTGSVKLVDGYSNANIAFGNTNSSNPTTVASNPWTVNFGDSESQICIRFRTTGLDGGEYYYIDEISLEGTSASSNDSDSEVDGPVLASQPNPGTISSLTDTEGEAIRVFDFNIWDYATSDSKTTDVTQVTINAGSNNNVDWSTHIQGAKLSLDGGSSFVTAGSPTINASSIIFPITSGNLTIPNGNVESASLFIYLENSGLTDNGILEFEVSTTSHGFTADAGGSTFAPTIAGAISNQITIDVNPTIISFLEQPTDVNVGNSITPSVEAAFCDANGNIDLNFATMADIRITASGATLDGNPVDVTTNSTGVAIFSSLQFSTTGSGVTLTANDKDGVLGAAGAYSVSSSAFDVTELNACGLEEFDAGSSQPTGWDFTNIGGTYTSAGNYGNSSPAIKMDNTGDIIETASVTSPSELSFWIKGQGTNTSSALLVEGYNGVSWITIENITSSIPVTGTTYTYNSSSSPALPSGMKKFRFTYTKSSGNLAFDDINITCNACSTPTVQASNFSFSNIGGIQLDVNFDIGDGDGRILVISENPITGTPTDNTTYAADAQYNNGQSTLNPGEYIIYNGDGTSLPLEVTGLSANTLYYFAVFEYGCSAGSEQYLSLAYYGSQGTTNYIGVGTVSDPICVTPSNSATVNVPFTYESASAFPAGTCTFTAELSNGAGDFSSPTIIGSITSDASGSQTIAATIPAGTSNGNGYRIRVNSTNPNLTGSDNNTDLNIILAPKNVSSVIPSGGDAEATISWVNPIGCYDEILVVCKETSSISGTPTGDGSLYTANTSFGGGTAFDGGSVVYKGSGANVTITNLINGNTYYIKIYTRYGTDWSSGIGDSFTLSTTTIFKPGDMMIVGFDTDNGSGEDLVSIVTFVDVQTGTEFYYTNIAYELNADANDRTDTWWSCGGTPTNDLAGYLITYNGSGLNAGDVITFDVPFATPDNFRINGTSTSDFSASLPTGWYANANMSTSAPDAVFVMQGEFTGNSGPATFEGTVIGGIMQGADWYEVSDATTGLSGNNLRRSRRPSDIECFAVQDLTLSSGRPWAYYNGTKTGTQDDLIEEVTDFSSNWQDGTNESGSVHSDLINNAFIITPGASPAGQWTGETDNNWFNCHNWANRAVPSEDIDVTIPASTNNVNIDPDATFSDNYADTARCKNLIIEGQCVTFDEDGEIIKITGNLTIEAGGSMDLNDDDPLTTTDGLLLLSGNYNNQAGNSAFDEGQSTIYFNGDDQDIASIASEDFYNVHISNTGTKSLNQATSIHNLTIESSAVLNSNANNITIGGRWNSYNESAFTETGSTVTFNGGVAQSISTIGGEIFNNLILNNSANDIQAGCNITINGDISLGDNVLDISDDCLSLNGNQTRTTGTITANTSSEVCVGGSGDFGNLYFTGGAITVDNFTVNRNSGSATLTDNLTVNGTLALSDGELQMNGNDIAIAGNLSNSGGSLAGDVSSSLTVNGSSTLSGDITFSSGKETINNFTLARTSGTANLGSNMDVNGTATFSNGILSTGSYTLNLGTTATISETASSFVEGNLSVSRTMTVGKAANIFGGIGININPASGAPGLTSVTRVTGTQLSGNPPSCNSNQSIPKYFDIQPTTDGGLDATIQISYRDNEISGFNEANLLIYMASFSPYVPANPNWQEYAAATVNSASNYIELTSVDNIGFRITLADLSSPLPIDLLYFNASEESGKIKLNWATATELNNDYFTIEHSVDATTFEPIEIVKGSGNSNQLIEYANYDENPNKGINYYRLKQTDFNGEYSYSEITSVVFSEQEELDLFLVDRGSTVEATVTNLNSDALLEVYTIAGVLVHQVKFDKWGKKSQFLTKSFFDKGIYIFKLTAQSKKCCKKFVF